jgi:hypothetical protein
MGRLQFGCMMFIAGVVCTLIAIVVILVLFYFNGDIDLFPFL